MTRGWSLPLVLVAGLYTPRVGADEPLATVLAGREVPAAPSKRDPGARFLAWGGEGERFIGAVEDAPVLFDLAGATPKALACPLHEDGDPIVEGSVSPDKRLGGVLLASGRVCVWDLVGSPNPLVFHGRRISHFALGVESVALGYDDGRIEVRDPRTGARVWQRNVRIGEVRMLRYDARGERLAVAGGKRGAAVLDPRSGRLIRAFGRTPASSVAFDNTHGRVAAGFDGGAVSLLDTHTWMAAGTVQVQGGRVTDLDFTSDGDALAIATWKGATRTEGSWLTVWDFTVNDEVFRQESPAADAPVSFRFSPHGMELIADNGAGWTRYWVRPQTPWRPFARSLMNPPFARHFDEGKPETKLPPPTVATRLARVDGAFALSPAGDAVLARQGGAVVLVGVADGAVRPLDGVAPGARVDWSGDGKRLLEVDAGSLTFRDATTGAAAARLAVGETQALDFVRGRVVALGAGGSLRSAGGGEKELATVVADGVTAVAVDPARPERVAFGGRTGEVRVRGLGAKGTIAASGAAAERTFVLGAEEVTSLAFSGTGKRLAVAARRLAGPGGVDAGGVISVFAEDLDSDETPPAVVLDRVPQRVSFVGDGSYVLAWSPEEVTVFEVRGGAVRLDLHVPTLDARFVDGAIITLDSAGAVRRIALPTGAVPWMPRGVLVAEADDQTRTVVVDGDVAELWNGSEDKRIARFSPSGQPIRSAALDPTNHRLALLYADGDVETYSAVDGAIQRRFHPPVDPSGPPIPFAAFSDDGHTLWAGAGPHRVVSWDVESGVVGKAIDLPGAAALVPLPSPWYTRIVAFAPTVDGAPVAWLDVGADPGQRVYDAADGRSPLAVARERPFTLFDKGGEVQLTNVRLPLAPVNTLRAPGFHPLDAGALTETAEHAAVAADDGTVRIWTSFGKLVATEPTDGPAINGRIGGPLEAVRFSVGAGLLWTVDVNGWIRRWDWAKGVEIPQLPQAPGAVAQARGISTAVLSPDHRHLYTGHADGLVRSWNPETGFLDAIFSDHAGPITALAVDELGKRVVSAADDGTVRLLDTATMDEKVVVPVYTSGVRAVAIQAGGDRFAALGDDGVLRSWAASPARALHRWALAKRPGAVTLTFVGQALGARWDDGTTVWMDPDAGTTLAAPPAGAENAVWPLAQALPPDLQAVASWPSAPRAVFALDDRRWWAIGEDDRLRLWDRAEQGLVATVTALTDGAWVVERGDGVTVSSPSLRDGSAVATQLFKPGDL